MSLVELPDRVISWSWSKTVYIVQCQNCPPPLALLPSSAGAEPPVFGTGPCALLETGHPGLGASAWGEREVMYTPLGSQRMTEKDTCTSFTCAFILPSFCFVLKGNVFLFFCLFSWVEAGSCCAAWMTFSNSIPLPNSTS